MKAAELVGKRDAAASVVAKVGAEYGAERVPVERWRDMAGAMRDRYPMFWYCGSSGRRG